MTHPSDAERRAILLAAGWTERGDEAARFTHPGDSINPGFCRVYDVYEAWRIHLEARLAKHKFRFLREVNGWFDFTTLLSTDEAYAELLRREAAGAVRIERDETSNAEWTGATIRIVDPDGEGWTAYEVEWHSRQAIIHGSHRSRYISQADLPQVIAALQDAQRWIAEETARREAANHV